MPREPEGFGVNGDAHTLVEDHQSEIAGLWFGRSLETCGAHDAVESDSDTARLGKPCLRLVAGLVVAAVASHGREALDHRYPAVSRRRTVGLSPRERLRSLGGDKRF